MRPRGRQRQPSRRRHPQLRPHVFGPRAHECLEVAVAQKKKNSRDEQQRRRRRGVVAPSASIGKMSKACACAPDTSDCKAPAKPWASRTRSAIEADLKTRQPLRHVYVDGLYMGTLYKTAVGGGTKVRYLWAALSPAAEASLALPKKGAADALVAQLRSANGSRLTVLDDNTYLVRWESRADGPGIATVRRTHGRAGAPAGAASRWRARAWRRRPSTWPRWIRPGG